MPKTTYIALAVIIVGLAAVASVLYFGFIGGRNFPPEETTNGELIYRTGIDSSGARIPFTYGPPWMNMRGGSCADCHGPTGVGGSYPMMCSVKAADIRYSSLISVGYNETTIRRAITKGLDESGESLDTCMPRWQIGAPDLNDLITYLKELG